MNHLMKLSESPYCRTKSGEKTIEGRLLDGKRKLLEVGDNIIFQNIQTKEELVVKVIKLEKYNTFTEMHDKTKDNGWAWQGKRDEFVSSFYKIYSKEDEKKYGTIAIYFELV